MQHLPLLQGRPRAAARRPGVRRLPALQPPRAAAGQPQLHAVHGVPAGERGLPSKQASKHTPANTPPVLRAAAARCRCLSPALPCVLRSLHALCGTSHAMQACPNSSVEFRVRPAGADLWNGHKASAGEVALMSVLLGAGGGRGAAGAAGGRRACTCGAGGRRSVQCRRCTSTALVNPDRAMVLCKANASVGCVLGPLHAMYGSEWAALTGLQCTCTTSRSCCHSSAWTPPLARCGTACAQAAVKFKDRPLYTLFAHCSTRSFGAARTVQHLPP